MSMKISATGECYVGEEDVAEYMLNYGHLSAWEVEIVVNGSSAILSYDVLLKVKKARNRGKEFTQKHGSDNASSIISVDDVVIIYHPDLIDDVIMISLEEIYQFMYDCKPCYDALEHVDNFPDTVPQAWLA